MVPECDDKEIVREIVGMKRAGRKPALFYKEILFR